MPKSRSGGRWGWAGPGVSRGGGGELEGLRGRRGEGLRAEAMGSRRRREGDTGRRSMRAGRQEPQRSTWATWTDTQAESRTEAVRPARQAWGRAGTVHLLSNPPGSQASCHPQCGGARVEGSFLSGAWAPKILLACTPAPPPPPAAGDQAQTHRVQYLFRSSAHSLTDGFGVSREFAVSYVYLYISWMLIPHGIDRLLPMPREPHPQIRR